MFHKRTSESNRHRRKKKLRWWPILFLLGLFLGSSWAGYAAMAYWLGEPFPHSITAAVLPKQNEHLNILLLGVDQRANEPSRSDTIILANLNPKTRQIKLISIPRDTRVTIPQHGVQKINHAHAIGGTDLLVQTVENFLGLPINYYVETNFVGFKNIIDLLGGVTIPVEKRMYTPLEGIDLKPGQQKLNGYKALAYVRYRGDQQGDIGRISRQQKFFQALANEVISVKTITKLPSLINELNKNIKTNMPTKQILVLANEFKDFTPDQLQAGTLPGDAAMIDGLSYWVPKPAEVSQLVSELKN